MGGSASKKDAPPSKYKGTIGRQLIEAAKANDLEVVNEIIASIDSTKIKTGKEHPILDAKDYDKMRPLHWAAFKGHRECIQKLIDAGASVEAQNKDGRRPLHRAANAGQVECLEFLIDYGNADPECANRDGWRPIHRGSNNGQVKAVEALLNKGAEKEPETVFGSRPLHFACEKGHLGVVKLLVNAEDDPEVPGWSCDINAANKNGMTPLHKAAQFSQKDVLLFLLSKGADKTLKDKDDRTPLDCAGEYGGLRDKRPIVGILSGEKKKKKRSKKRPNSKGGLFGKRPGSFSSSTPKTPKKQGSFSLSNSLSFSGSPKEEGDAPLPIVEEGEQPSEPQANAEEEKAEEAEA